MCVIIRVRAILLLLLLILFMLFNGLSNVYSQSVVTIYVKFPDNSPCSYCIVLTASGSIAVTDRYGKISIALEYDDYVYAFYYFTINDLTIIYSGGKIYNGSDAVDILEIIVRPRAEKCFYPVNFSIVPQFVQPGGDVVVEVSWVFAKCCPNCVVYVTLYMENKSLVHIWSGGDAGYTHKLITARYSFKAPQTPGVYRITLNVIYSYRPPAPHEGVVRKNELYVVTQAVTITRTTIVPMTYTLTQATIHTVTLPMTIKTTETHTITKTLKETTSIITKEFTTITDYVTIEKKETITQTYSFTITIDKEIPYTITLTSRETQHITHTEYITNTELRFITETMISRITETIYTNTITMTYTGLMNIEVRDLHIFSLLAIFVVIFITLILINKVLK